MRVVVRVERIHSLRAELLVRICSRLPVIDEDGSDFLGGVFGVADEAVGRVSVVAGLPDVVGCGTGDDDVGAFEAEERGGVCEVAGVG